MPRISQEVYEACRVAEQAPTPLEKIAALLGVQARSIVDRSYIDVRVFFWMVANDPTNDDLQKNLAEAQALLRQLDPGVPVKKAKGDNEPAWGWLWRTFSMQPEHSPAASQNSVNGDFSLSSSPPAFLATGLRPRQPSSKFRASAAAS